MSAYNPDVALKSESQDKNISLRYIQTIQEAGSIGKNKIYWNYEQYNYEVSLLINSDKDTVIIKFSDENFDDIEVPLSNYKFLIGSFEIS